MYLPVDFCIRNDVRFCFFFQRVDVTVTSKTNVYSLAANVVATEMSNNNLRLILYTENEINTVINIELVHKRVDEAKIT